MTYSDSDRRAPTGRWGEVPFDAPATFRILLRGRLDSSWEERLGGMQIRSSCSEDGTYTTELRGRLADQAALSGVLNTLYDLQLTLVLVECLDRESGVTDDDAP